MKTFTEVHYAGTDREETVTRYANGKTYVEGCTHYSECPAPATVMVEPYSLCADHAKQETDDRAKRKAYLDSEEFQALIRSER